MQEFTKRTFHLPMLDKFLSSEKIDVIDVEVLEEFQQKVEEDELEVRQVKLRKEKPLKSFLIFNSLNLGGVSLFLMMISVASPYFWFTLLFLIFSCFFGFLSGFASLPEYKDKIGWKQSPFSDFEKEYKGEIAKQINSCRGSHKSNHLLRLSVEWHPFSKTRFLLVNEQDDEEGGIYCIDYWEKPESES